jgi:ribonuclease P protein component
VTYLPSLPSSASATATARVAFAVARRVGPAVVRYEVRRRLRAAVRELASASPELLPNGAYLLAASPQAAKRPYEALRDDLRAALTALVSPRSGV